MNLNIDLNYILKRIIVIVLAFVIISQLKSCNVQAMSSIDLTSGFYNNCRGYYTNSQNTLTAVYGTVTLGTSPDLNYSYCKSNNWSNYTYNFVYFQIAKSYLGTSAPNFEVGKSYNVKFSMFTEQLTSCTTCNPVIQLGPNNITKVVSGFYSDPTSSYNVSCDLKTSSVYTSGGLIHRINYDVTCSGISLGDLTNWSYLRLYVYIDRDNMTDSGNLPEMVSINNVMSYEENITQNDVYNSLNDSSVDSSTNNGGGIFGVDSNGQSTVIPVNDFGLSGIVLAPLVILNRAKESCTPKSFILFQKTVTLPCGDSLFWTKDFSSQSSIFDKGHTGSGLNTTRDGFRAVWNALFGGAIIFHLLVKLWDVIQRTLDPTDNGYETISSAIDTGPKPDVTRDTDGDEYIPKHTKSGYIPKHKSKGLNPANNGGVS